MNIEPAKIEALDAHEMLKKGELDEGMWRLRHRERTDGLRQVHEARYKQQIKHLDKTFRDAGKYDYVDPVDDTNRFLKDIPMVDVDLAKKTRKRMEQKPFEVLQKFLNFKEYDPEVERKKRAP